MSIIEWWNSLSSMGQIFVCVALPSTLVLLIQTVLMFIGFGENSDAAGDTGIDDIPDGDFDIGEDFAPDQDFSDVSGFDGLRIFTLRGIIAFFVVFGWVGVVMDSASAKYYITLPVATVCGFAVMVLLAVLFRVVMNLRNDGNADNRNAVGVSGKVHLTIPKARTGEGKVHIMLQGSYVERNAVTDDNEPIPTGSEVVVIGVSGETDLIVKRK